MIKPTVGRSLHYYPGSMDPFQHRGGPLACILAHVWSDTCINVTVFDMNGHSHSRTSVPLIQDGDAVPENGPYCAWMPFQVGQAKKTEELQAKVDENASGSGSPQPGQDGGYVTDNLGPGAL